ncbi:hypothetical protein O3P69_009938 [Scylla paramamosain]|uniref:Uncharacterized protein n=1 Tax=Scylla paramamosain TaxID=85552 RepID=A0AAW0SPE7_SCYPA
MLMSCQICINCSARKLRHLDPGTEGQRSDHPHQGNQESHQLGRVWQCLGGCGSVWESVAAFGSFLLPCIEHRQVAPKRHEYISFSLHRTPSSSTKEARVHKVRSGSSDTMAKQRPCGGGGRGRRQRACQVYHQAGSLELP